MRAISIPIQDEVINSLKVGDSVALSGTILTGRDAVHKWLTEVFILHSRLMPEEDWDIYEKIRPYLNSGVLYHCGPVAAEKEGGRYQILAAGPTTSIREEPYQADVMRHFNIKAVIGKGGMGSKTLRACQEVPGVYLHAVGGAAAVIARAIVDVPFVLKLDFGLPEAIWCFEVKDFPAVVTMDAHGNSLHAQVEEISKVRLASIFSEH